VRQNFYGRSFLTLLDYNKEEIQELLSLAAKLKAKKHAGVECSPLKGKNVVLTF